MVKYYSMGLSKKDDDDCAAQAKGWHNQEPRPMSVEEATLLFKWRLLQRRLRALVPIDQLLNWSPVLQSVAK